MSHLHRSKPPFMTAVSTACLSGCLLVGQAFGADESNNPSTPSAVATASAQTPPRSSFLSWFSAVLRTDRSRPGKSAGSLTATAGIRGLDNDGANAARFHSEQLQALKLYSLSRNDAEDFANSAGLTPSKIAYVSEH